LNRFWFCSAPIITPSLNGWLVLFSGSEMAVEEADERLHRTEEEQADECTPIRKDEP